MLSTTVPPTAWRCRLAQAILLDAQNKAAGSPTRVDQITTLSALLLILVGFVVTLKATQPWQQGVGLLLFLACFTLLFLMVLSARLPVVSTLRARLARCGLEAAYRMNVVELAAARWAIGFQARTPRR